VRGARLLLAALCLAFATGAERPPGLGDVVEVRHWSYDRYTRVVVELTRPASSEVRRLASDPAALRPERLYVDLPGIWVGRRYVQPIRVGDGLLRGVRLGQNTLDTARLVIDLERYQRHRVMRLASPDRVVIDVFAPAPGPPGAPPAGPTPRREDERGAQLPLDVRGVQTVVLDPGHGGSDPGAIGYGGLQEKNVTLNLARRLRPKLESRGFRVVLTREADRTLSLEERTALAAGSGGDLFVSLHANASPRRVVRGIETYYLDASNERQSLRVAARENGVSPAEFDRSDRTLVRLRLAETSEYSSLLARLVQRSVVAGVRQRHSGVEDLGVKKGPFYVLFLSSMPSILVETGFISHRDEARRLRSTPYLDDMAEAVAQALSDYRTRVGTVVAQGGS